MNRNFVKAKKESVRQTAVGAVLPSYLMYIYEGRQLLWYFVVSLISVTLCFVLTYMFGIPKEVLEADGAGSETGNDAASAEIVAETEEKAAGDEISVLINSPLTGKAVPMKDVPDDTFAAEVLGKGMAGFAKIAPHS